MTITANQLLNVAIGWLGYSESNGKFKEILNVYNSHKPLARNYKIQPHDEWCDAFVSAVAIKAGAVDIIGTEVGVERHVDIFKAKGIWHEDGTEVPKPGDIIVFNWNDSVQPNNGRSDHIGYVVSSNGKTITCIEGNLNERVAYRTINVGWGYIRGFARPKYGKDISNKPSINKTIDQLAKEVLQGVWGNGSERHKALIDAGYDADAVQKRVNELYSGSKKSVNEVAVEVLRGEWGNGSARKEALKNAGFDVNAIQQRVNELYSEITKIAKEVIAGKWGNGSARKEALKAKGYPVDLVQKRVNELS